MALKSILNKLENYGGLVMFSHSLFSLPFGFIAMLWAGNRFPGVTTFIWISIALLGARNGANAFNRIADRDIDRKNPRTLQRHLPAGTVRLAEAYGIMIFCFAALAYAAYRLNPLCLYLLPFAILWVTVYSYTKRMTWLCHFILGAACGMAPVGAWIAVTGTVALVPVILGGIVCLWVGGFDIIYATQDMDFDRKEGLHSIPARFGLQNALRLSALSHIGAVALMLSLCLLTPCGFLYLIGVTISALLLIVEHYNVAPGNRDKMIFVSYSMNQIVSVVFFMFCMADFLIREVL